MAYKEDKNPLTGKGDRHKAAAEKKEKIDGKSIIKPKDVTNLPIETLDEMISFFDEYSHENSEKEGFEYIEDYLIYLRNLRKLYWKCPSCKRMIAPDEKYAIVNNEAYCEECNEEM